MSGQVENAIRRVRKALRVPAGEPLIRGGLSAFVLRSRYDYSEFGRMIESRELPQDWLGHWQSDALDVYVSLVVERELEDKQAEAVALQVVAAAYLGAFEGVPNWFAEGTARNLVASSFRRGDPRVAKWQASFPAARNSLKTPRALLEDALDEETSGVVGMALTSAMMTASNRMRFSGLIDELRKGTSFEQAFAMAYGSSTEAFIQQFLGLRRKGKK